MSGDGSLGGFAPFIASILLPTGAVLYRGEQVIDSGRRLRDMARQSRAQVRARREAVAAQEEAERAAWIDTVRATTECPQTRRALAGRFKEVSP